MTHLYLIRHGEAVSNVEPIIGGMRGDTGLSPLGVRPLPRCTQAPAAAAAPGGRLGATHLVR